jgi:hypothetical protein
VNEFEFKFKFKMSVCQKFDWWRQEAKVKVGRKRMSSAAALPPRMRQGYSILYQNPKGQRYYRPDEIRLASRYLVSITTGGISKMALMVLRSRSTCKEMNEEASAPLGPGSGKP